MANLSDKLYQIMDKGPLRALSLVLALVVAFCVFGTHRVLPPRPVSLRFGKGY